MIVRIDTCDLKNTGLKELILLEFIKNRVNGGVKGFALKDFLESFPQLGLYEEDVAKLLSKLKRRGAIKKTEAKVVPFYDVTL